jgi:hypothetical protein
MIFIQDALRKDRVKQGVGMSPSSRRLLETALAKLESH